MQCEKCKKEAKELVKIQFIVDMGKIFYGDRQVFCVPCYKKMIGE